MNYNGQSENGQFYGWTEGNDSAIHETEHFRGREPGNGSINEKRDTPKRMSL